MRTLASTYSDSDDNDRDRPSVLERTPTMDLLMPHIYAPGALLEGGGSDDNDDNWSTVPGWQAKVARLAGKGKDALKKATLAWCVPLVILLVICVGCLMAWHVLHPEDGNPWQARNALDRRGSFLVLGDWGHDPDHHGNLPNNGCQSAIGQAMLDKFHELGDVQFIINLGDSFYPNGVANKTDLQWDTKWRKMFSPELRSVPWYSVYGNHDLHKDPCACADDPRECAQINADINNHDFFFMPNYTWSRDHPDLGVEVVGMDLNHYMWGWDPDTPWDDRYMTECYLTACPEKCISNMRNRAAASFELFEHRRRESSATSLLVFSHYPTDGLRAEPGFIASLSDPSRPMTYFGGHRHTTDNTSTISTAPNANWVVGGGGGWGCQGDAGIVVGEIGADGRVSTYRVLADPAQCCQSIW